MATPISKSPQDLFRANTIAIVETLSDLVKEIVDAELRSDIDTNAIEDLAEILDTIKSVDLVEMFILAEEEVWPRIVARDSDFLQKSILSIFKKLPNNMDLLALPVLVYFELVEGKHANVPGMQHKSNWPITQEDVNSLWIFSNKLLRNAYNYSVANPLVVVAALTKFNLKVDADNRELAKKGLPLLPKKRMLDVSIYKAHVEAFTASLIQK